MTAHQSDVIRDYSRKKYAMLDWQFPIVVLVPLLASALIIEHFAITQAEQMAIKVLSIILMISIAFCARKYLLAKAQYEIALMGAKAVGYKLQSGYYADQNFKYEVDKH